MPGPPVHLSVWKQPSKGKCEIICSSIHTISAIAFTLQVLLKTLLQNQGYECRKWLLTLHSIKQVHCMSRNWHSAALKHESHLPWLLWQVGGTHECRRSPCSSMHKFHLLFNKYVLSAYFMLGTYLWKVGTEVSFQVRQTATISS